MKIEELEKMSTDDIVELAGNIQFILRRRAEDAKNFPAFSVSLPTMTREEKGFVSIIKALREYAGLSLTQGFGALTCGAVVTVRSQEDKDAIEKVIEETVRFFGH